MAYIQAGARPPHPLRLMHHAAAFVFCSLLAGGFSHGSVSDIQQQKLLEQVETLGGLKESDRTVLLAELEKLSYTERRLILALSSTSATEQIDIKTFSEFAANNRVRFSFLPLIEKVASLPDSSPTVIKSLLPRLKKLPYVTEKAVVELSNFKAGSCRSMFLMMDRLEELGEAGLWASKALFRNLGPDERTGFAAVERLAAMTDHQCRAAEQLFGIAGLRLQEVIPALQRIGQLDDQDAINSRSLFMLDGYTAADFTYWVDGYFAREHQFRDSFQRTLPASRRQQLLEGFYHSTSTFTWRINNLHDVTDSYGREIGSSILARSSWEKLSTLFQVLHPDSRKRYGPSFQAAVQNQDRQTAVNSLRTATSDSRKRTAEDLSAANIYAILANGSELYDSSFRDILVPELHRRVESQYSGSLLDFLQETDIENRYVSDFITNLARKGKLTLFLPSSTQQQKKILDIVAVSALHNEDSLILFAAAFTKLLQPLTTQARSYLLDLMLSALKEETAVSKDQLQVILQYYHDENPGLLVPEDRKRIEASILQRGRIDLTPYLTTHFGEWKADGRLASLSVFQNDDDGRSSYISYCRTLADAGYRPSPSARYHFPMQTDSAAKAAALLQEGPAPYPKAINQLLSISAQAPLAVDWTKRINTIEIIHTVYMYHDQTSQKRLLKTFLLEKDEMFAQRGHSYWRHEQLFEPLESLMQEKGEVSGIVSAKRRFISLGSCGGIRAYSKLNSMFKGNVDILASVGTGTAVINNPYNMRFFEFLAENSTLSTWQEVKIKFSAVFSGSSGSDYIQPGSLPAVLHKMRELNL